MVTSLLCRVALIWLFVTSHQVSGDLFTTMEFSPPSSTIKREVVLHPEELGVRLTLGDVGEDETVDLTLCRQRDLDLSEIPVYVDGHEWKEDFEYKSKRVSFYHDLEHTAALSVTAEVGKNGDVKRTLRGTVLLLDRAYEVSPVTSKSPGVNEYLTQRGLDNQQTDQVHLLKEFDLEALLHRLHSKRDGATRQQNFTKEFKQEENHQSSANSGSSQRIKGSEGGASEGIDENDANRYQRVVSDYQTDFHVEIQFLIDDSVYEFLLVKRLEQVYMSCNHQQETVISKMIKTDTHKIWRTVGGNAYDHNEAMHEIKYYYAHIFNGMRLAYRKIQYYSVNLWLTNITIFTTDIGYLENGYLVSYTAFSFIWDYILYQGLDWRYPDHVMLWTKNELHNSNHDEILGSSYICGVCDPGYQVSVNMDEGFFGWVTGAHELGHNLGASHDGVNINGCQANSNEIYIMALSTYSLTSGNIQYALSFSPCSKTQIYDCMTGNSNTWDQEFPRVCVYNKVCSHKEEVDHLDELPGQKFDLSTQCRILLGEDASFSDKCEEDLDDICKELRCDSGDGCYLSHSIEFRAAPGTPCGKGDKVCFEGKCVPLSTLQYTQGADGPCDSTSMEIPDDCTNTKYSLLFYNQYYTCDDIAALIPWKCFSSDDVKKGCSYSCMKYGLYKDNDPLCKVTIIEETTSTPPIQPPPIPIHAPFIYPSGLDIVFCDTELSDLGGVRCPSDPANCVPIIWMCDGVKDCLSWEDEEIEFCQKVPCPAEGYVRCRDEPNLCVLESWLCDGKVQCPDNSDENQAWCENTLSYCYTVFGTEYKGYNCPNDPSLCVPHVWTCDGIDDCAPDAGEIGDETQDFCDSLCPLGQVRCPIDPFKCIPTEFACDGQRNCAEGSDEDIVWCRSIPERHCIPGYVNCPTLKYLCIPSNAMCDSVTDCYDDSDESENICGKRKREPAAVDTLIDLIQNRVEPYTNTRSHSKDLKEDKDLLERQKERFNPTREGGRYTAGHLGKRDTDTDRIQPLDLEYLRKSSSVPIKKAFIIPDNAEVLDLEALRRKLYTEN